MPESSVPFLNFLAGKVIGTRMIEDQIPFIPSRCQKGWLFCNALTTALLPIGIRASPRFNVRGIERISDEDSTGK